MHSNLCMDALWLEAIFVMEMEDVFETKRAWGFAIWSEF